MLFLAFLAIQLTDAEQTAPKLNTALASSDQVLSQAFECMDAKVKIELKKNLADASPEAVVEGALQSCDHIKKAYAISVSADNIVSPVKADELAEKSFKELRNVYLKHVDELLAKPEVAKARLNITVALWRQCVNENAKSWSRLADDASTIGRAAVTSCAKNRTNVQNALSYEFRSIGLLDSSSIKAIDKLDSTMIDVATEIVISERAKRLPKLTK